MLGCVNTQISQIDVKNTDCTDRTHCTPKTPSAIRQEEDNYGRLYSSKSAGEFIKCILYNNRSAMRAGIRIFTGK